MTILMFVFCSAILLSTSGCGNAFDDHFGDDAEHRGLAQGFTPCGDFLAPFGQSVTCHPNQYCANSTFSDCSIGCLSNYNCSHDQICYKKESLDICS